MMKIIIKYISMLGLASDSISSEITHPNAIRLFRKIVYAWVLLNTLILLPAHNEFWSSESFIPKLENDYLDRFSILNLLNIDAISTYYPIFLALQILLLIIGILCLYPRLVSLLIYFLTINIDNKAYVILDGGNNLIHLILLYMVLLDPSKNKNKFKHININYLNNCISNLGFLLVRLQVVMVYLVSGLAKVDGNLWQNGTALYYTLNVDEYSHPFAKELISKYPLLSVIGTYSTVIYQVCFPWLVWNRKIRPYLLAFGTFLHIQISFVMGLFMFGLAIAVSYFAFSTDEFAKRMLMRFDTIKRFNIKNKKTENNALSHMAD